MRTLKIFLTILVGLIATTAFALEDGFDGGSLDPIWEVITIGQGPTVTQSGGELTVTIPTGSTGGGNYGGSGALWISTGIRTTCEVVGDFDFSTDFRLVEWPAYNGVRAGIGFLNGIAGQDGVVHRMSVAANNAPNPSDYFVAHSNTGPISVATQADAGRLRVVRIGSNWTGYYDVGAGWVEIGTVSGPSGPINPEIRLWCQTDNFAGQDVSVAFDNFSLPIGVGCESVVADEAVTFGSLKALYR